MITTIEYEEIKLHRADIIIFNKTGKYKGGNVIHVANRLRQKYAMAPPINFGCDACKSAAMNDLYNIMVEYERENKIV